MVRLVPVSTRKERRGFGAGKGKIWISDDFDAPLDPAMLKAFGIDP